jgi:hypothetical protein
MSEKRIKINNRKYKKPYTRLHDITKKVKVTYVNKTSERASLATSCTGACMTGLARPQTVAVLTLNSNHIIKENV